MNRDGEDVSRSGTGLELAAAVVLAIATVVTAWSAFQATKWSGVQANNFSAAGAARTESVRATATANFQTSVDVGTFVAWVSAVADERGTGQASAEPYTPEPGTLSGFLYERLRGEFVPAVDAWLETRPLITADAPSTPFDLPEYRLAAVERADALEREAEERREEALRANQRADNYVLLTVLFAMVLLFAGVSTKLVGRRARLLMFGLAVVVLVGASVTLATFPVEI